MAAARSGHRDGPPLGQHFLRDRAVLGRETAYAELRGHETVLEIGPGPGVLTAALLARAGRVIAIERDTRFCAELTALQRREPHLELVWGDALAVPWPRFDKLVANLPYSIALPALHRVLDHGCERAVVICQRRLAERMCAGPGEPGYCRLGIAMGRRAEVQLLEVVPPNAFVPAPAVDSAIIQLRPCRPRFVVPDEELFRYLLESLFEHRDRPLGQALALLAGPALPPTVLAHAVQRTRRQHLSALVRDLHPKDFGALCCLLWAGGARIQRDRAPRPAGLAAVAAPPGPADDRPGRRAATRRPRRRRPT